MSWPITIDLTNGHSHGADLVICAIGVSPNAGWLPQELERSGDDGGVLVDRHVLLPMLASSSVARFFWGHSNGRSGTITVTCHTCHCRDMQTSVEDIWAAGDVCTVKPSEQQRHWFQMRLWTQVLLSPTRGSSLRQEAFGWRERQKSLPKLS